MHIIYAPQVADFIVNLSTPLDARARRMIKLLEDIGSELRMPFSKRVEEGLFELRVVGAVQVRFLYFFYKGEAVIAHAFFKKTEKVKRKDIEHALLIRKMFLART